MADGLCLAGSHNALLVKRKQAGGVQFSKDPLNLTNKHSRKVRLLQLIRHSPAIHYLSDLHSPARTPPLLLKNTQLTCLQKYSSLANPSAIGLQEKDGKITLLTKLGKNANKPAKSVQTSVFKTSTPSRKVYRSVVSSTHNKGYRADLRAEAVARASQLKKVAAHKKQAPAAKLRGRKAEKAAAAAQASA